MNHKVQKMEDDTQTGYTEILMDATKSNDYLLTVMLVFFRKNNMAISDAYLLLVDKSNAQLKCHLHYNVPSAAINTVEDVNQYLETNHVEISSLPDEDEIAVYNVNDTHIADVPEYVKPFLKPGIKSIAALSINSGSEIVALLMLTNNNDSGFHGNKLQHIQELAAMLLLAIIFSKEKEAILNREREANLLLSFCNDIAEQKDNDGLAKVIKRGLKALFHIDEYSLSIKNEDNGKVKYFLFDLETPLIPETELNSVRHCKIGIKESAFEKILNAKESVVIDLQRLNALSDERLLFPIASFWKSIGINEVRAIPLRVGNENVGLLWIRPGNIQEHLIKGVSSQIAIALARAAANAKIESHLKEIFTNKQKLEVENLYLQEELESTHNYREIVGGSEIMKDVFELISKVAETKTSILILGETGTGKELIARALHNASSRKDKLMVKVNCAALPANLIESELFGHEKGSFTGAMERRIGKFELANNSTIFLDEIGELPLDLQVKLLRALQEKEIERVGGKAVIQVNVRVIAATNRNLQEEVRKGNFRSDLYFRLNVFPITLPPLRERKEDLPKLTAHFLQKHGKKGKDAGMTLSVKAMKQLMAYDWPGNIRELEHLIERSMLLASGNVISQVFLPNKDEESAASHLPASYVKTINEVEREHIIEVLKKCGGKISGTGGAAELLRIPATTLNSKMARLKIKKGIVGNL